MPSSFCGSCGTVSGSLSASSILLTLLVAVQFAVRLQWVLDMSLAASYYAREGAMLAKRLLIQCCNNDDKWIGAGQCLQQMVWSSRPSCRNPPPRQGLTWPFVKCISCSLLPTFTPHHTSYWHSQLQGALLTIALSPKPHPTSATYMLVSTVVSRDRGRKPARYMWTRCLGKRWRQLFMK